MPQHISIPTYGKYLHHHAWFCQRRPRGGGTRRHAVIGRAEDVVESHSQWHSLRPSDMFGGSDWWTPNQNPLKHTHTHTHTRKQQQSNTMPFPGVNQVYDSHYAPPPSCFPAPFTFLTHLKSPLLRTSCMFVHPGSKGCYTLAQLLAI